MVSICDRVRYVETDMMGVVHHSNYFRWFEMGRVAWLRAAGVELWELTAFSRAKMDFTYRIVRKKDGALLAEGCSRNVFTDNNGHIIRLSGDFYDRINAFYQKEQAEEKH